MAAGIHLDGRTRAISRTTLAEWARILELLVSSESPMTCEQLGIKRMPAALSGEFALVQSAYDSLWESGDHAWLAAPYAEEILDGWQAALESGM